MVSIQQYTTEHTLVEDSLRKEKAFIEGALNSLQDVFYVFDLNGKFLRWNKSFSAVTGYSDEEMNEIYYGKSRKVKKFLGNET